MLKVAIVGTVPNSRVVAPYDDPSWEIWACSPGNHGHGVVPRVTRWFELHSLVDCRAAENRGWWPQYVGWLAAQSFPIYMQEKNEDVPRAVRFPREPLLQKWGPNHIRTNWFTSSIAWMMAYAIHLGAKEIGIFGVDMAATEERYGGQKAGCLRFAEIARELGIKVVMPLESTLAFGTPLYGYAESSRMGRAMLIRELELKETLRQLEQQGREIEGRINFFRGALEQVSFDRNTFVSGLDDAEIDDADDSASKIEPGAGDRTVLAHAAAEGHPGAMDQFQPNGSGLLIPSIGSPVATKKRNSGYQPPPEG